MCLEELPLAQFQSLLHELVASESKVLYWPRFLYGMCINHVAFGYFMQFASLHRFGRPRSGVHFRGRKKMILKHFGAPVTTERP